MVNASKIMAIINPDSAPAKRLVQHAKEKGKVIDATQGRRTRAVLVMDDAYIILSALMPETIANRCKGRADIEEETDIRSEETGE